MLRAIIKGSSRSSLNPVRMQGVSVALADLLCIVFFLHLFLREKNSGNYIVSIIN